MLKYIYNLWFSDFKSPREEALEVTTKKLRESLAIYQARADRYEHILSDKNAATCKAQTLYVTEHAVSRYKQRIGYNGDDNSLRKLIYKQTIRHLSSLDSLPDGRYDLNKNVVAKVKDNTVVTIIPRGSR